VILATYCLFSPDHILNIVPNTKTSSNHVFKFHFAYITLVQQVQMLMLKSSISLDAHSDSVLSALVQFLQQKLSSFEGHFAERLPNWLDVIPDPVRDG